MGEGYVMSATNQAQNFADLGWGTADRGEYVLNADGTIYADGDGDSHRIFDVADFKIGDVFSDNGHVWICLGVCEDGSMVFMHSTPSNATVGKGEGGGIQISALDLDGREDCMAIQLANHYMETYYPQWCERYAPVIKGSSYINVYDTGVPGTEGFKARKAARFSWDLSGNGLLTDPEGYADMTPTEILGAIFNDEFVPEKPAVEMPEAAAGTDYAGEAVYLGLKDFTTLDTDVTPETDFVHVFAIDGVPYGFTVATGEAEDYAIQNKLMEGYIYNITAAAGVVTAVELQDKGTILMGTIESIDGDTIVVDGETVTLGDVYEIATPTGGATITDNVKLYAGDTVKVTENAVYKAFVAEDYEAPVAGTPGKLTLKNFLTTALQPVGTALYVYGGCWDWEDDASSPQSTTIGLPQSWIDFFQSHDNTYHYKQKDANGSYANSVYTSNRGWNQYYYAGVDCSAYVAWTAYNVQNTESGGEGYVCSSTNMAYNFAQNGWGTYDRGHQVMNADGTIYADGDGDSHRIFNMDDFKVGDVFSDNGHAWICLGVCEDDSMVFLHSTPSNATEGAGEGGGIQISALDLQGRETCEAYELACEYMEKYYPQWCERYTPVCRGESYVNVYDTGVPGTEGYKERKAGKMSWTLDGTGLLTDPDGYANMTPAEILEDIFEEDKGGSSGGSSKPSIRDDVEVVEPAKTTYTDVPETHWAYEAIEAVTEAGLFNGTSATTFSPEMDTTRGQLMTVLARLSGEKAGTIAEGVAWAVANGVSDGTNPEANITREQLVTMLYRYAQLKGKDVSVGENTNILSYDDAASVSEWAIAAMQWACGEGIIKGMTESTLVPGGYATRAQIATIMQRYAGL